MQPQNYLYPSNEVLNSEYAPRQVRMHDELIDRMANKMKVDRMKEKLKRF